jgi:hypothetical protein
MRIKDIVSVMMSSQQFNISSFLVLLLANEYNIPLPTNMFENKLKGGNVQLKSPNLSRSVFFMLGSMEMS